MEGRFSKALGKFSVDVSPAFADGQHAAYITTEYWTGFSTVWVQPMYVMVRNEDGKFVTITGVPAVFSVGPDSAFYSPYWRVFYVVVPATVQMPDLRTTRAVLDSGYPLIPGPPRLCALAPPATDVTGRDGTAPLLHPLLGTNIVGGVGVGMGWVDGFDKPLGVVTLGDDRFTYKRNGTVDEAPLYVFRRQAEGIGAPMLSELPSVGGRDLNAEPKGAAAPDNRPAFGALWRFHFVDLPSTAGVLVPENSAANPRVQAMATGGFAATAVNAGDQGDEVYFRPTLDVAKCATDVAAAVAANAAVPPAERLSLTSKCAFLDSQAKIHALVQPNKIVRSDILATCPWVSFHGKPVPIRVVAEPRP